MQLRSLLLSAGFSKEAVAAVQDREINGISSDSRAVRRGEIFVAIRGLHCDGTQCIGEALSRGAALVISERPLQEPYALTVEDARGALACLWDAWYGHPTRNMRLIGITGTNGKTSTAAMLCHILRECGYSCGLVGTVGNSLDGRSILVQGADRLSNMTTPDPAQLYAILAQMRDGGAQYVVMEVTSHALVLSRVAPLRFYRGVFTNLTPDHLDLHGDMESYFAQKCRLFEKCEGGVISCFGPYGVRLADGLDMPLWRVDEQTVQTVSADDRSVDFEMTLPTGEKLSIHLPVAGKFSVENGALAAFTAIGMGLEANEVKRALSAFVGVRGRMERLETGEDFFVFLDYAHTPDALEKLLLTVRGFCARDGHITVLFGCGGDRDRSKRPQMGAIASRLADLVILTSDNCRSESPQDILRDIMKGIDKEKPYRVIEDRREAIRYAIATARPKDLIVLAGKGHEEYEIRGRERLYFSEREIVQECLLERKKEGET